VGTGAVATDAAGAPALESPDESVPTPTPSAPASGEGLGSAIAELAPASPESSEHPAASSHCSVGTPGLGSPPYGLVFCLGLLGLARRRRARA
jgi:MYXO-CTERM domain-containing protein